MSEGDLKAVAIVSSHAACVRGGKENIRGGFLRGVSVIDLL